MANIKRKKLKESNHVIEISDLTLTAEVEESFESSDDRFKIKLTGGAGIKFGEWRRLRPYMSKAIQDEMNQMHEEILWGFVFDHFTIEAEKEFEQSAFNLGFIVLAIWNAVADRMDKNKKK